MNTEEKYIEERTEALEPYSDFINYLMMFYGNEEPDVSSYPETRMTREEAVKCTKIYFKRIDAGIAFFDWGTNKYDGGDTLDRQRVYGIFIERNGVS